MKRLHKENPIVKNWFADWANEYDATLGKVRRHHKLLDLVVKSSGVKKGDKVLDIGCGTGLLSLKFLKKTSCDITGVDNSPEMISIFRDKINRLGIKDKIRCRLEDAADLKFKKSSFDILASTVALHHIKNKLPVIKKINRVLKPGGKFILGDIDMDTTGELTDERRLSRIMDYLKAELALAIKEGGIDAFNRMYDNGRKHILNDGEYCISFGQWRSLCSRTEFRKITVIPLPGFELFKVLVAVK